MKVKSFPILVLLALFGGLFSCQTERPLVVKSDFTLLLADTVSQELQTVGVFGGAEQRKVENLHLENASFKVSGDALWLRFQKQGFFKVRPSYICLPASWINAAKLEFVISCDQENELIVEVIGSRSRIRDTLQLKSGKDRYAVSLKEIGLTGGVKSEPLFLNFLVAKPMDLTLNTVNLLFNSKTEVLVDRFGQRALADYPQKIKRKEELLEMASEMRFLDSLETIQKPFELDDFGGYRQTEQQFEASGFFHTQYKHNRWWMVTPEGNPFFSLGVNGVRRKSFRGNADVTLVDGRRDIFEHLPFYHECPECFREDSSYFSFYAWNIRQKYHDSQQWKAHCLLRLRRIGFNTIGNWSDTLFYEEPQMPYTLTLDTRKNKDYIMDNGLPDVFNPGWVCHVDSLFSQITASREDPFLVGYFVDNELGWRDVVIGDSSSYTARAFVAVSQDSERMTLYAAQYFKVIAETLKKYDPNHLYLGCRFTRNFDQLEGVAQMAGRYVDVLSVNVYSPYPIRQEMDTWYNAARKPIMIGEHHIPPRTDKQLWPVYDNFELTTRDRMLQDYLFKWASYPYAVGAHWYQFKDQEVAGRAEGGENQPVGLVTVTDRLNERLAALYHSIALEIPLKNGLLEK